MFKEFFIGRCFVQAGICPGLSTFVISTGDADYQQIVSLQTVRADVDGVDMAMVQLILGPIMIGIGAVDAR